MSSTGDWPSCTRRGLVEGGVKDWFVGLVDKVGDDDAVFQCPGLYRLLTGGCSCSLGYGRRGGGDVIVNPKDPAAPATRTRAPITSILVRVRCLSLGTGAIVDTGADVVERDDCEAVAASGRRAALLQCRNADCGPWLKA